MGYYYIQTQRLIHGAQPPANTQIFASQIKLLLPPLVTKLHRSLQDWADLGYAPGPMVPERIWFGTDGTLAFYFAKEQAPQPLLQVGLAPDLAAWLVLLDKWTETFVVLARARTVWNVQELAGALTFMTPAFLPRALVNQWPDNWASVASALAQVVADGELAGISQDRHWQAGPGETGVAQ
jgi:hypothetical protein